MKKACSILLALVFLLVPAQAAFAQADAVRIDAGWDILVPAEPTSYETFAAEKLSQCLAEVFGAAPQTVTQADGPCIALGAASAADASALAENGYRIAVIDGNLHISGTGVRGLQAGVYRFLEEFCGRKVYTAQIIELPQAESIEVPADTDLVYAPFFEYTDTDWRSPCDVEYSVANGLNGGTYRRIPAEMGGNVNYLGGFCHTMGGLCETARYAESHPEYLALHDGARTTDQPCLTNPEVLAIATRNVLNLLASGHDPAASVQIVSVTQNDNYHYCECDRCKAFEAAHGGVQSATMLQFVNQIADAVKAAGYDNVAIDTFAYQYTRQAPTGIVPRENVIVRLCTIECCFCHALDDPSCSRNTALMKDLADWAAICNRLYVWDYTTNYLNTCLFFPDLNVIQRNIQVFYENHVRGVYEEGNYYIRDCDTEFGELRAYMIAKSLQDPYRDLKPEVQGFLAAYYGPGWEAIEEILQRHLDAAGGQNGHLSIGEGAQQSYDFSGREVAEIDALWAEAKAAAADETQLEHLTRTELSWRFWKSSAGKGEFSVLNPARFDERQQLFEDLQAFGVRTISEGGHGDYLDCICIRYAPAAEWNMYEADEIGAKTRLFFGGILESMTPFLSAYGLFYRIAQRIYAAVA